MVQLLAVGRALPGPPHPQTELAEMIGPLLTDDPARRQLMDRLHAATEVRTRHLALAQQDYSDMGDFGRTNDLYITRGSALAESACLAALAAADVPAAAVGFLMFTSVTGISAPSIDAGLVGTLGLRPDVARMPSFGLGCAGGAAGVARMRDFLLGHPHDVGLLVSLELCSLTMQHGDDSTANLVSTGLFGDGAAAVVMAGNSWDAGAPSETADGIYAGPLEVLASASHLYPGTEDQLGWHVGASGFAIMLGAGLPALIAENLADDVDGFLGQYGLHRRDIGTWVVHAGGPRVLDAVESALELPGGALQVSRESLAAVGNLSSASVLHVLAATLQRGEPPAGGYAVLMAFGPGVSAELVLLHRPERVAGEGEAAPPTDTTAGAADRP